MGGQNDSKIMIFGNFVVMFLETYFLVEFCWIFDKNDGEKHMEFHCCLRCCFIICLLNLLFSVMLETLKIVIFLKENAYFYKISFFAFDVQRCRKTSQTTRDWEAKGLQKSMKFEC